MKNIIQFLNDYLSEHGIKQSFVSEKAGISADLLSKTLKGERRLLADEFIRICKAIKIPEIDIARLVCEVNEK